MRAHHEMRTGAVQNFLEYQSVSVALESCHGNLPQRYCFFNDNEIEKAPLLLNILLTEYFLRKN